MGSLDTASIADLLNDAHVPARFDDYRREILSGSDIHGIRSAKQLSGIIDDAVSMILQGLSLPEGFTVMMGGANGRQQITPHSDLDIAATAVDPAQLLEVGNRYRDAIYKLLTVLKIHGEIDIDVLQEIGQHRSGDELQRATFCMDARLLWGSSDVYESMQRSVESEHPTIITALGHEQQLLHTYKYTATNGERINEYGVDFDIKQDRGGLRHLYHTLWFIACLTHTTTTQLVETLKDPNHPDHDVYQALDLLLHIRAWLHLQSDIGQRLKKDTIRVHDWENLQAQFGEDILARIHDARNAISSYQKAQLQAAKKEGMEVGGGIQYTTHGLSVNLDRDISTSQLIQLLQVAQNTRLPIDSGDFRMIRSQHARHIDGSHQDWATLMMEPGKFSTTIRRLDKLGCIDAVLPGITHLHQASYEDTHPYTHMSRFGRAIAKVEQFERLIESDRKSEYNRLSTHVRCALRIALICKDIPKCIGQDTATYFSQLATQHPGLSQAVQVAVRIIEKRNLLFHCANMDNWLRPGELHRIAKDLDTDIELLDAIWIYTCAARDYGDARDHQQHLWRNVSHLHASLRIEIADGGNAFRKLDRERMLSVNEAQQELLEKGPRSFLRSTHVSEDRGAFCKMMQHIERVQSSRESHVVSVIRPDGSIELTVIAPHTTQLPALVSGVCQRSGIDILSAELHAFRTDAPVDLMFLEILPSKSTDTTEIHTIMTALSGDLTDAIHEDDLGDADIETILSTAEPSYLLEPEKETDGYILFVKAKKNTAGFLHALFVKIANTGTSIRGANVYTHLRAAGCDDAIEDVIHLDPHFIDEVQNAFGVPISKAQG